MKTALDLFAGGGLASQGLRQAGFTVIGAVELDEACCRAYADNYGAGHVINAPVGETDPRQWEGVELVWLSPPCQQSSSARNKSLPRHVGADAGLEAIPYLEVLRPRWVLLENVPGYVREPSFAAILDALERLGYFVDVRLLNSADFGVAQTRRRLIVRACRDSLVPAVPAPTPWAGWYGAIEDLVPSLPESRLADWQVARLPEALVSCLIHPQDMPTMPTRRIKEPAFTIVAGGADAAHSSGGMRPQAFLVGQQYDRPTGRKGRQPQIAAADEPAMVVTASLVGKRHMPCAVLIDSQNSRPVGHEPLVSYRAQEEPALSVCALAGRGMPRALLIDCTHRTGAPLTVRDAAEPAHTIVAGAMRREANCPRALLVSGAATDHGDRITTCGGEEPAVTVITGSDRVRALLERGRTVRMTPRALARFQSCGDDFLLPASDRLACRIVGQGCPPRMVEALARGLAGGAS